MIADIFIDRFDALVDVRLSETRDIEAAKAFFCSAKGVTEEAFFILPIGATRKIPCRPATS